MLPRLLRLHPSTYQRLIRLSKEAEKDGAYRVAKRWSRGAQCGRSYQGQFANILKAPRSKVSECCTLSNSGNPGAAGKISVGPAVATDEGTTAELGDILDSGPVAYGLDTGI